MTSRKRNLSIIALVLVLLAASFAIIATKRTVLGLDLRGGVELVYEGRATPQVPEVTPEAVDDAIETIRKRTDALGAFAAAAIHLLRDDETWRRFHEEALAHQRGLSWDEVAARYEALIG